ncbi:MAG: YgiQ family radical SAM protein [Eggerthellaceae bacterium]|nr:YgiQ family radical SAM protein [Eggerthellaceae bacterium]
MPQATNPSADSGAFLPINRQEMTERGWDAPDFVYVCGDAYVDHPSFGHAIIGRMLERAGYKVCMICQPDVEDASSVTEFGHPRLGFLVSAGNMDSMVNHYTVAKKRRKKDAYSPGGIAGARPDRATIEYCKLIRKSYPDAAIIIGGIEASLRRFAHYDYWSDSVMRSILLDSGADLISYGMGERSIMEIADALDAGLSIHDLTFIDGTSYATDSLEHVVDYEMLPSWDEIQGEGGKRAFGESFAIQYRNSDPVSAKRLVEPYPDGVYVVQNAPQPPLTTSEMDAVYRLPFTRTSHPSYDEAGGVPALKEVEFSIASSRGCFGECSFCALTFHQGRHVSSRSKDSIMEEAKLLTERPGFKGYIHDVGGPTANFRKNPCKKMERKGACTDRRCLGYEHCAALSADHSEYVEILRTLRELPEVKRVFVRSGIRYDYAMLDEDPTFLEELVAHHVSGQLKVAPEHISDDVLKVMGKPSRKVYEAFTSRFKELSRKAGKKQYLVPYLMSSHPGSTLKDAVKLAEFVRDMGYNPEQVQDFYPTPGTLSTAMYYTGHHPLTGKRVHIPKSPHEKAMQRALIQYRDPKNARLVKEALKRAGRTDLIGRGPKCLVK